MSYGNPKLIYAKKKGFRKKAYIAKMYGGRPTEEARKRFFAAPYAMQRRADED